MENPTYNSELKELVEAICRISVDIRLCTSTCLTEEEKQESLLKIRWYSEILHNLDKIAVMFNTDQEVAKNEYEKNYFMLDSIINNINAMPGALQSTFSIKLLKTILQNLKNKLR